MIYCTSFPSSVGTLTLYSDGTSITAITMPVWRVQPRINATEAPDLPVFQAARIWLGNYFTGNALTELPALSPSGTHFQRQVWSLLMKIPHGTSLTYGEIARQMEENTGHRTSPRAVGHAVGCNPVAILIPCHRVLGANQRLTGFGGGLDAKRYLLTLEGIPYRE